MIKWQPAPHERHPSNVHYYAIVMFVVNVYNVVKGRDELCFLYMKLNSNTCRSLPEVKMLNVEININKD